MGIVNRSLDSTEATRQIMISKLAIGEADVCLLGPIPYPSVLKDIKVACRGVSGTPTYEMTIERFIVGTGYTSIAGGMTTLAGVAMSTSGIQTAVIAAAGSAVLNLMKGDVLAFTAGTADSAVTGLAVSAVIKATQDIKSWY